MAPLAAAQHRGLITAISRMMGFCLLFLFASCAEGKTKLPARRGGKPVVTNERYDHTKYYHEQSHKTDKERKHKFRNLKNPEEADDANGLPAVWYGPTLFTTAEQIQEQIFDENKAAFIEFGSNRSVRTRNMKYAWDKLGRYMYRSNEIVIGRVDCRNAPKLCKDYKITRYPTIRYFKMGAEMRSDSHRYHGSHEYHKIKQFSMKELGGMPQNCPLVVQEKTGLYEGDDEKCLPVEKRFMEVHLNKTYPRILAIIREIKKRERLINDKLKFPMEMMKLNYTYLIALKQHPEKKAYLDKEFAKNVTEKEKSYVEDRIKRCRFIRTMKHVYYFNQMVHKAYKEEGIGSGLPPPDEVWIKWAKYQDKLSGGNKVFVQHSNGTVEQTSGMRDEDIHFTDEERTFDYMEGVDEFLDEPKWNGPPEDYPERFPESAIKALPGVKIKKAV